MAFLITQDCNGCGACRNICPSLSIKGQKKKLHKIDELTCINCYACGRICPFDSIEDNFGRIVKHVKKKEWEKPRFNKKACMSCNICIDACPAGVINLGHPGKNDPHPYPLLADEKDCLGCGFCAMECPVDAITMAQPDPAVSA